MLKLLQQPETKIENYICNELINLKKIQNLSHPQKEVSCN